MTTSPLPYLANINLQNKNNSHTIAYDYIALLSCRPLKILEVGCSAGYFGAALKRAGHSVYGVEPYAPAAEQAAKVLDGVHTGTLAEFFACHSDTKFDVIVFGDVLEHLANPRAELLQCHSHLENDGYLISSVPNISHACIRAMLLNGRWDYSERGILDRTHLRFFTRESLTALLHDSRFELLGMQDVILPALDAAKMCGLSLNPRALDLVERFGDDDSKHTFQYVALSTKQGHRPFWVNNLPVVPRVLAASDDIDSNIATIRLVRPLNALASIGLLQFQAKSLRKIRLTDLLWSDIVVMQREASRKSMTLLKLAQRLGKVFIFEIDDLLTALPEFLNHHEAIIRNKDNLFKVLDSADIVCTTTERLKHKLSVSPEKVFLVPNYTELIDQAPARHLPLVAAEAVHLVIASSDLVLIDFILPPIKQLKAAYGDAVKVVAIGPNAKKVSTAIPDTIVTPVLSLAEFRRFVSTLTNPIGLIPLDDSEFSSCKSAIKYYDYSLCGLVTVCSNVPPYSDVISHEQNGFLVANDPQSWFAQIRRLVEDPDLRVRVSVAARCQVMKEHSLQRNVGAWGQALARAAQLIPEKTLGARRHAAVYALTLVLIKAYSTFVETTVNSLREKNRLRLIQRRLAATQKKSL